MPQHVTAKEMDRHNGRGAQQQGSPTVRMSRQRTVFIAAMRLSGSISCDAQLR